MEEARATMLFWVAVVAAGTGLTLRRAISAPGSVSDAPAPALAPMEPSAATGPGSTADAPKLVASAPPRTPSLAADARLPSAAGSLTTMNSSQRSGYYFLPARTAAEALPLLVLLHGQGGDGRDSMRGFGDLAESFRLVLLAPSSRYSKELGTYTWEVGDKPNDVTDDFRHVQACLDELLARTDVTVNRSRVLIAGFSAGASSAAYVATNAEPYGAFAVLHGGVFPGGLGERRVRGWFSTGKADPARPPAHVQGHFETLKARGFSVVYREYPGGHELSSDEAADVVEWWLHGP